MRLHLLQSPVCKSVQPKPGDQCIVTILSTVTTPAHQCPVIPTIRTLQLTPWVRCQHLVINNLAD